MKVAIIGFAREGRAAYDYWHEGGHDITICDFETSIETPPGVEVQLGPNYLHDLGRFDLIVRTAGLHPGNLISKENPEAHLIEEKITTSVDELLRVCPTKNVIGVTGTKGKGTTSTLIANMLEAAGYRVHLGGNIGIAPLKLLESHIQPEDWVVLELSSFQLIDLKRSPHIAVCVTMGPEHLNWHADMDEYITAKQQLFRWQQPGDFAIYYGLNELSGRVAKVSPGKHIPYMSNPGAQVLHDDRIVIGGEPICHTSDIQLPGKHNWQNVCAAITAVWQVTHDVHALRRAIASTTALPHRLELVTTAGDVRYYNDSFASAPDATVAALDAVPGTKVLIVGGYDRGLDLSHLVEAISAHKDTLRKVLVVGAIGARFTKILQAHHFDNFTVIKNGGMMEIVKHAKRIARAGDSVLLSPGAPSFDMFKDFEDRGEQFRAAVHAVS